MNRRFYFDDFENDVTTIQSAIGDHAEYKLLILISKRI